MQQSFDTSANFLLAPPSFKSSFITKKEPEKKNSGSFFALRNSRGASPSNGSRKSTVIEEDQASPAQSLRFQKISEQRERLKATANRLNQFKSETHVLPSLDKQLSIPSIKQLQKQQHLKYKDDEVKKDDLKKKGNSQIQVVQRNISSVNSSNPLIQRSNKGQRLSSMSKMHKVPHITLEQAIIDSVILYHEKNNFMDFYDNYHDTEYASNEYNFPSDKNKNSQKRPDNPQIPEQYRCQMLNWMIQVFRVLKVSSAQTYFLAVSILDRYCIQKFENKKLVNKDHLYLIGLTAIFISSKFEDVIPIRMKQVLEDAGHLKFNLNQILKMEQDILTTLSFNLYYESIYDLSAIAFKDLIFGYKKSHLPKEDVELALKYMLFLCQLCSFSTFYWQFPLKVQTVAIVNMTFQFLKRKYKYEIESYTQDQQLIEAQNCKQHYYTNRGLRVNFRNSIIENIETCFVQEVQQLQAQIVKLQLETEKQHDKVNLEKNFKCFLGQNAMPYSKKSIKEGQGSSKDINR